MSELSVCSSYTGHVKKNNRDEVARVFIQLKVWLKRRLGQLEGEGTGGACPSRGRGCGHAPSSSLILPIGPDFF